MPDSNEKFSSPRFSPLFKAKPEAVRDQVFKARLREQYNVWEEARYVSNIPTLDWWEKTVKPGIRKLLRTRGREIRQERRSRINLLQLRQSYLVKKIQECEEERKSILQGIKTFQSTLYNSGDCENLRKVCENLKIALENVSVKVNIDAGNEKMDGQAKESKSKRKCRYFNRGYCKYGMNCRFYHSQLICKEYAEEGGCQTTGCSKRHPRQCRYWTENPEGCRRSDACQYLHVKIESLSNNESDKTDTQSM